MENSEKLFLKQSKPEMVGKQPYSEQLFSASQMTRWL